MKTPNNLRAFADQWSRTGKVLQQINDQELRNSDPRIALQSLQALFDLAIQQAPLTISSGLVEWQLAMRKLSERSTTR